MIRWVAFILLLLAASAQAADTREIILQCGPNPSHGWIVRLNPATRVTYFIGGGLRSRRVHAEGDASHIVFRTDPTETIRIDREAMTYTLTRKHWYDKQPTITAGTCRALP